MPLGYLPLLGAPSIAVMALLVIPAGACIAPLITAANQLVGDVAPPGTATEAYTWPITALLAGIAAGNAGAGALVEGPGWRAAFAASSAVAAVGAAVVVARRGTLTASGRRPSPS
jgi:MFS family permease